MKYTLVQIRITACFIELILKKHPIYDYGWLDEYYDDLNENEMLDIAKRMSPNPEMTAMLITILHALTL